MLCLRHYTEAQTFGLETIMASAEDDSMDLAKAAEQQEPLETENRNRNSEHLSKLRTFKVQPELVSAADVLLMTYSESIRDPEVKKFFDYLKDVLTPSEPANGAKGFMSYFTRGGKTSSPTVTVKVHTITTGLTFGADAALMSQVKNFAELQVKEADQCGGSIIILFCPITSRPGSDLKVAMSNVPGDKPVILVMMHHTRKPDYCIPGTSWCDNFPNVILHVDILFHETFQGLLMCSNNDKAVRQIQLKLLKICKKST